MCLGRGRGRGVGVVRERYKIHLHTHCHAMNSIQENRTVVRCLRSFRGVQPVSSRPDSLSAPVLARFIDQIRCSGDNLLMVFRVEVPSAQTPPLSLSIPPSLLCPNPHLVRGRACLRVLTVCGYVGEKQFSAKRGFGGPDVGPQHLDHL